MYLTYFEFCPKCTHLSVLLPLLQVARLVGDLGRCLFSPTVALTSTSLTVGIMKALDPILFNRSTFFLMWHFKLGFQKSKLPSSIRHLLITLLKRHKNHSKSGIRIVLCIVKRAETLRIGIFTQQSPKD